MACKKNIGRMVLVMQKTCRTKTGEIENVESWNARNVYDVVYLVILFRLMERSVYIVTGLTEFVLLIVEETSASRIKRVTT